jgi:O-antigen/teichoic acid export membrane protein
LIACLYAAPELKQRVVWDRHASTSLLRFGGWMTVSNVISPLMVTLDRFLIGAFVSVAAVTYYATPYEVITKFLLIPAAVMGVMFPAFSTSFAQDRNRTAALYNRCVKYMFFLLFPAALVVTGLARDGLTIWLGADFAQHSVRVLQWLAVGVFLNCLAQVPFALVQGAGRPDLTAKLHLIELPCYLFVLWRLIATRGIEGAAMAWTLRAAVDGLCLFGLASRFLPSTLVTLRSATVLAVALLTFAAIALLQGLVFKGILLGAIVVVFVLAIWFQMLTPEERQLTQEYL